MTDIKVKKSPKETERFQVKRNKLWGKTVAENDRRLDQMELTPENMLQEIKLIEAALLTRTVVID